MKATTPKLPISFSEVAISPDLPALTGTIPKFQSSAVLWSSGVIANRPDLLQDLEPGPGDARLLLKLYERYGLEAPSRLAGTCAWILRDKKEDRWIAVRDRLGTRQVYYSVQGQAIRVSGDLEELLGHTPPRPNLKALSAHLRGRPPEPGETLYEDIRALRPAEMLAAVDGQIDLRRYWQVEPGPSLRLPNNDAYSSALQERLEQILAESLPEGPLGVALSAGMDSTLVTAMLRKVRPKAEIIAFNWTAEELPEANEGLLASEVAKALGCLMVPIHADRHWPLCGDSGIHPSREGPLFNYYTDAWEATFRKARELGITTLLTGLGGDSLFGGDAFSYPDLLLTGRWVRLASEIRSHLPHSRIGLSGIIRRMVVAPVAHSLFPSRTARPVPPPEWLGPRLRDLPPETPEALRIRVLPGRQARLRILRDPFIPAAASLMINHAARFGIDFHNPLLDHRLFEFVAALPSTQTFAAGQRKIISRNVLRKVLPAAIVERLGKTYPTAIAHRGLRERERSKVWSLMTGMRAAEMGLIDEARLRKEYRRYLDRQTDSLLFWQALTLEAWLRLYF